jgi:hypothetical protein
MYQLSLTFGPCSASKTYVLLAGPDAARVLSLTLSLFVTTRHLTIDTTYAPVPRSKKRKLQSVPKIVKAFDHAAEVTPRSESSLVHVLTELQHLDFMDATLSDRIRLRVAP